MLLKENPNRASVVLNLEDEDDILENDFVFVTVGNENEVKKAAGESCLLPDFEVSDFVEIRNELEVSELKTENVEDKQVSSADEKIPMVSPENQDKVPTIQQLENENEGNLSPSFMLPKGNHDKVLAIENAFPKYLDFARIITIGDLMLVPAIKLKFVVGCPGGYTIFFLVDGL